MVLGSGGSACRPSKIGVPRQPAMLEVGRSWCVIEFWVRRCKVVALCSQHQAGYWISCVGECSRSKEGQAELVQKGRRCRCWLFD